MNPSRFLRFAPAAALAAACAHAAAQSHEQGAGQYTLRANTVSSMSIDPGTAKQHGIRPGHDTALLNVVVLRKGSGASVAAHVDVTAHSLTGREVKVGMKEVGANGGVSYMGTYPFVPGEVLDFSIRATPRASPSATLTLTFRDRLWR